MTNVDKSVEKAVKDPRRLAILQQLELLDSPAEHAFDRLTRLASKIIGAPVSLVSLVDADRQFFKSFFGLPEPWASERQTPLSHSFCQHVVSSNKPLVVQDAREVPFLKNNLAIPDLNVIAYLGVPITTSDGAGLGSFCVIDSKPRVWTEEEIEIVRELAESIIAEIELRYAYRELEKHQNEQWRLTEFCTVTVETLLDSIQKDADKAELLAYLQEVQKQLAAQASLNRAQNKTPAVQSLS